MMAYRSRGFIEVEAKTGQESQMDAIPIQLRKDSIARDWHCRLFSGVLVLTVRTAAKSRRPLASDAAPF
jgi:hypothetical protein